MALPIHFEQHAQPTAQYNRETIALRRWRGNRALVHRRSMRSARQACTIRHAHALCWLRSVHRAFMNRLLMPAKQAPRPGYEYLYTRFSERKRSMYAESCRRFMFPVKYQRHSLCALTSLSCAPRAASYARAARSAGGTASTRASGSSHTLRTATSALAVRGARSISSACA